MKPCALLLSLLLTLAGCPVWAEDEIVTGPDRRGEIDLRIAELDAQQDAISMQGPKVATFVGLGTVVAGAVTVGAGAAKCNDHRETYQSPTCGPQGGGNVMLAGSALFGVGAILAISGGVVWGKRVNRRDAIEAERKSLVEERDGLAKVMSRLELGGAYRDGKQFVTLGVRF